jgi:hypothetical protein
MVLQDAFMLSFLAVIPSSHLALGRSEATGKSDRGKSIGKITRFLLVESPVYHLVI